MQLKSNSIAQRDAGRRVRQQVGGLLLLLTLAATTGVLAQEGAPTPPCATSEYRHFDFWVGEWTVTDAAGAAAGTNRIEKTLGGCVLHEHWQGIGGVAGESFNIFHNGRWHQFWVDAAGRMLRLEGGLRDGKMSMAGERIGRDGKTVRDEITWEKLPDGRVRQHWRVTTDGGETWSDAFEGFYSRAGQAAAG